MPSTRGSFPGLFSGEMTGTLDDAERRSSWIVRLRGAGYRASFVASSVAFGRGASRVDVGTMFDETFLEETPGRLARPASEAIRLLDDILARRKNDRILVVLHLFLPHAPYWRDSYSDNVTLLDHDVASILDVLQRRGLYDRAHVILTSDHGESLQEHGAPPQHGWNVYGEETRIPLVWKASGQRDRHTVTDLVRNFDIGPTLLALLALSPNDDHVTRKSGRAIPELTGVFHEPLVAFHTALANRMYPVPQIGIRTERYLMVKASGGPSSTELYDYQNDPAELYNIASTPAGRGVIRRLEPILDELSGLWINTEVEKRESLSPEMRKTLESLGYLGTGPSTAQLKSRLVVEAAPGVRVRFHECFSQPWASYAAERHDSLFPIRIIPSGGDLFVISNATRDLIRLRSSVGRVRPREIHGGVLSDVWFERKTFELTAQGSSLLALIDRRTLKKYYVNPGDYRLDSDGETFGETVGTLAKPYDDLLDASRLGVLLFAKDALVLRHPDGRIESLGGYSTDSYRTAVDAASGVIYIAEGPIIIRVRPGKAGEVFKDAGAAVFSLALHGRELWVGTHPIPSSLTTNNKPIIIYDTASGKEIGSLGSRLLRDPSKNFWGAIDVGPFGIIFPRQIVFDDGKLYVLDSGLERILTFDVL